jgi:hypothetical protein
MKPREFNEIMIAFVEEDKRWKALKVGDSVYTCSPAGLDLDYFRAEIKEINLEERYVIAYDRADRINPDREIKLTGFLTQEEFNNVKF